MERLEQSLAELGRLGETMIEAIEGGDNVRLLAAMQVARGLRARLKGRIAPAAAEPRSPGEVERLRELVAAAQVTDQIAERWLARALPPDCELLAAPHGALFLADAMLPAVWDFERDLVVLVGPGLAGVAEALGELGQGRIFCYRPGEEGCPAGALCVEDADELAAAVRGFGIESPQRLAMRTLDPDMRELCAELAAQVDLALSDGRIQRNTVATFHRTWLEQGLANLPALCRSPSVAALDGELAGKPLVIIAPGPSLARNIHLLAQLKGKAVLLAVSHALTPLARAGVVPDFVLAVDPQDLRYHYAGIPLDRVAAVINAATVHPELFALGAPHYLTLSANGTLDDWLCDLVGEPAVVGGGGSVATTAFSLALRWGCDPIAVVGLDLSFPGGRYYIDTSSDGDARAVVSGDGKSMVVQGWSQSFHHMRQGKGVRAERIVELPGWHGEPVPSSFMFAVFHRWFEETIRRRGGETELYNCTEGGASIEGMTAIPLARFVERVADVSLDPAALVARAADAPTRAGQTAIRLRRLAGALRSCRQLARRCIRLAGRHTDGNDALGQAERALLRSLVSLRFLSMLAQAEIGDALLTAREVDSVEEAVVRSARLFEAVDRAASWLLPRVEAARRTLAI